MSKHFCDELNNVITFFNDKITTCCGPNQSPLYYKIHSNNFIIDFSFFKKKKKEYLEYLINQKTFFCYNCFFLRERKESDVINDKYNEINISHWTNCNCHCIYCSRNKNNNILIKNLFQKRGQHYDLLPIVQDLYKNDLLDKENLIVRFQGGDIGVLEEFEDLVKEFDKNGTKMFHFLSNNIIYQPIIAEMFKKDKAFLITSLDCGSKETYKKIKKVNQFDKMINNLKRYKEECGEKAKLNVKYVIVENYNDNLQEAKNFLSIIKEIKIPIIQYDIDYRKIMMKENFQFIIPSTYYKIYELFEKYCKENNCTFDINPYTRNILEQGYFSSLNNKKLY